MYNRNYSKTESFQDLMSRLYPASELSSEVRERVLYDENGKPRKFVARTCTFQVTDDCNLRCSYCLTAGTKIRMGDYTDKNIEDIELGDKVLGFTNDPTNYTLTEFQATEVTQLFERQVPTYLKIHLSNGSVLNITENHKVLCKVLCKGKHSAAYNGDESHNSAFVPAGSLDVGDQIVTIPAVSVANISADTDVENLDFVKGYKIAYALCTKEDPTPGLEPEVTARILHYADTYTSLCPVDDLISEYFDKSESCNYMLGFLSAVYDMYGSIGDYGHVFVKFDGEATLPNVCHEMIRCNKYLGFNIDCVLVKNYDTGKKMVCFEIANPYGDINESQLTIKILSMIKPAAKCKGVEAYINNGTIKAGFAEITSIEAVNTETTVYNIGTSTHTYIANDALVHNCYQICKQHHVMDFETAKKFADMILEANLDNNEYIDVETSPGIVFEFIGGEPFMAIDLIQKISDYIVDKMIKMNHPWKNKFMFSICSNGVLYKDKRVQAYMQKYKYNLSFSISIDGNKELHDSCRVFPDGSGSYDIAIAGVEHFREHYNGKMGSKMTMAPSNISYVFEAVKNLIALKYDEIFLNCVYEKGWEAHHATELYGQFKKLTDYIIDNDYFDKIFLSYFDDTQFKPMAECENDNWCGGTGSMISCDYKGDIYPCIRYMESSIGEGIKPLKIGNVNDGVMHTDESIDCVHCLRNISRRSQSTDECFNCPIAGACSWCSAYNYQENGTADKRCTYICIMHKGRALANIYYWNKGFRKYAPWFRFASWIPKQWALEIISEEEYDMLMDLIKFDESDVKRIQEMLDNNEVPDEYITYAMAAVESKKAVFTNDLAPIATKTFKEDGTPAYDMNYNEEVSEDDLYDVTEQAYAGTFNFIEDQKFDIQAVDYLKSLADESTNSATAWMGGSC